MGPGRSPVSPCSATTLSLLVPGARGSHLPLSSCLHFLFRFGCPHTQPSLSGSLPIRTPDFCPFDGASATLPPPAGPVTAHRLPHPGSQVGGEGGLGVAATADLRILIAAGLSVLPADPSIRPSSAGLTLSKAALSDLCHCHQASPSWPVVHQTGDLAFCFSEKIEAFCLHPLSQQVHPPHTPFGSLEPSQGPSVSSLLLPPTPSWTLPGVLCFHNINRTLLHSCHL